MAGWTLALLIPTVMNATPKLSYAEAYQKSVETNKPLVILIGADWCVACDTFKQNTIAELKRDGALDGVVYTTVDLDKENDIASKLMRGDKVPQLLVFHRSPAGWQKQHMVGLSTQAAVRAALKTATEGQLQQQKLLRPPLEKME
ncbi:MAG: thioredoxin family protein [Planctomycetales bacterium]|nr:thioredoxin family protein [Planctomycetales bacterium]